MKKKLVLLATLLTITVAFSGCSLKPGANSGSLADVPVVENPNKDQTMYTYEDKSQEDGRSVMYILSLNNDDDGATLFESYVYNKNYSATYNYIGTYIKNEKSIVFRYSDESEGMMGDYRVDFIFDGEQITGVSTDSSIDLIDIAGSYNGEDDSFGKLVLTVEANGDAKLITEVGEYDGSIYQYEEGVYNFSYYPQEESGDEAIDWIITLDGDQFTHTSYNQYRYGDHAGSIKAFGDFGELEFVFDNEGMATTTVEYNGMKLEFSGNYYLNEDNEVDTIYFESADGYTMDIYLQSIDGKLNYSGKLSIPLSAG